MGTLEEKIKSEMISDYRSSLEKNFDLAKKLIKISSEGTVEIIDKNKFSGEELVLVYMIGKCYAKEAGLSKGNGVTNSELINELGKPEGSIFPWLKSLREANKIKQNKSVKPIEHYIPINLIEDTLIKLTKK